MKNMCALSSMALVTGTLAIAAGCSGEVYEGSAAQRPPSQSSTELTLDPSSLTFFGLPINSYRNAVGGFAKSVSACVSIIWDYSNTGKAATRHCNDFSANFPYVVMTAATTGPCNQWDYAGNTQVLSATGCIDFAAFAPPSSDSVDVTLDVSGPLFSGRIHARSP